MSNQSSIDRAYQEGVKEEQEKSLLDLILFSPAEDAASTLVPDSLRSDEENARERGREDARRGNIDGSRLQDDEEDN